MSWCYLAELDFQQPGIRVARLALGSGFTNFSRPDIRLDARQPPTVAGSLRSIADRRLSELPPPNRALGYTDRLTSTAQAANLAVQTVFKTLARIFQYILPLVCLVGAAVSAWKNSQGKSTGQLNLKSPVAPSCPACGSRMVKREAKRGTKAGGYFWGCSEYPKCRGTVQI